MGVKSGSHRFVGGTKVERSQSSSAQQDTVLPGTRGGPLHPPRGSIVSALRQVTKAGLQSASPTSVWYPAWDEFC